MKLRNLLALSLIIFGSCVSMMLFVAFVLIPPPPKVAVVDPNTGLPIAATDQAAGVVTDTSGLGGSAPASGSSATGTANTSGSTPTPKPGSTPAPTTKPGGTPTPTPGGGGATPIPTKTPAATPVPTPVPTATPKIYCSGVTPCYGPTDLTANGRCWGYIGTTIINLTNFAPNHPGLSSSVTSSCGMNVAAILAGGRAGNGRSRTHSSSDTTTLINGYSVTGRYDSTKP